MNTEVIPAEIESSTRSLLLVDDEENILSSLRRLLRRDGYRIFCANSGEAGLDILKQEKVDVIVSDQRMPQMTGTTFLRHARDLSPDSVRIILSGYTDLASVTDAINEGAVYKFLTKPWDDDILRLSIKEALYHKWISDENRMLHGMLVEVNEELAEANLRLAKQAESAKDSLNTHQAILETLPFPLLWFGPAGKLIIANRSARELFPELAAGNSGQEKLPNELSALFEGRDKHLSTSLQGRPYQACRSDLPDTQQGWVLCLFPKTTKLDSGSC